MSAKINQEIRKAEFVPMESQNIKIFKYRNLQRISKVLSPKLANLKRCINTTVQKVTRWNEKIDWSRITKGTVVWLAEAAIEGVTANFATHFLFHIEFNPMTVMAHGFAIKQGLDIYWRLKKDGSTSKLPKK